VDKARFFKRALDTHGLKSMTYLKVFFQKPHSNKNFQMWHTHLRNFYL